MHNLGFSILGLKMKMWVNNKIQDQVTIYLLRQQLLSKNDLKFAVVVAFRDFNNEREEMRVG